MYTVRKDLYSSPKVLLTFYYDAYMNSHGYNDIVDLIHNHHLVLQLANKQVVRYIAIAMRLFGHVQLRQKLLFHLI